jgi:hypothetical protein
MLPKLAPSENQYGEPVGDAIPARVAGVIGLDAEHRAIWELARPHLRVGDNDAPTL